MAAPQQRPGPVQISASLKAAREQIRSKSGFVISTYENQRSITLHQSGDNVRDLPKMLQPDQIHWVAVQLESEVGLRRLFIGYFGPRYPGPIPLVRASLPVCS